MGTVTFRVRSLIWFVAGAMTATAMTLTFVNAWRVDAAPGDTDTTFVPITACRLVDTRQAGEPPLGPQDTRTFAAHGPNGDCTIPSDAVALSMNVTADNQTAPNSFLTIWKDGPPRPSASSLNPAAGQPPTPNAVTTDLSAAGKFNVYNDAGTVNVLVDVTGYHTKTSLVDMASRLAALEGETAALRLARPFAVSSSSGSGTPLTDTPASYASVTVTAPADGHVTVNSTAVVTHQGAGVDERVDCVIVRSTEIPANILSGDESGQIFERAKDFHFGSISGTRTFSISAGDEVVYVLACEEVGDEGGIFGRTLTAIFTPAP